MPRGRNYVALFVIQTIQVHFVVVIDALRVINHDRALLAKCCNSLILVSSSCRFLAFRSHLGDNKWTCKL